MAGCPIRHHHGGVCQWFALYRADGKIDDETFANGVRRDARCAGHYGQSLRYGGGPLMKWVRYGVNIIATLVLGLLLSRWIDGLPYEFPVLPASIAFVMRALGMDTIRNADDIETVGLLVIIAASMLVAAVLVWLANIALRRWRAAA
ncbi:hypothetical protein C0Z18_02240 [Trinickia dabaoshanensis]|uniref:Uncharacterized protein n=1 Tax=Trinickia dabaoshanensis TaxID=564714 RepID=A0A2N7W106_9BURK|nr:hypothetical protein C0Z18_02240 [Trinickia dabaoshanensis]